MANHRFEVENAAQKAFRSWIDWLLEKNELRSQEEFAERIGVSRMAFYCCQKNPGRLSKLKIAGIQKLMNDDVYDTDELCMRFGIAC